MMRKPMFFVLFIILSLWQAPGLQGGEIAPGFAESLKNLGPDDYITGLVYMKDKVDLQALTRSMLYPVRLPSRERHERVVRALQETAEKTQAPVIHLLGSWVSQGQVQDFRSMWIANLIAVTGKAKVFYLLAERGDVGILYENRPLELIRPVNEGPASSFSRGPEPGILATRAPELWAIGIRGQGALVCNIDTGVDGNHPALATRWRGLVPGATVAETWFDPVTGTVFPTDFSTHGTHTMGTICGDDLSGNQIGMAPAAQWIAAATIDRVSLDQTKIDALASFQWCADPDGDPSTDDDVPDVASNSWGFSPFYHSVPPGDPYFWDVIDGCEAAGCAVVFAAGNEGSSHGSESLRTPADRITSPVNVLAVGGLEPDNATRAWFSSMGPSGVDHFTKKPDVMAQGEDVRSSVPGGGYGDKDGTSMACPHVAGAIALLKSAVPEATPYEVKAALLYTADDLGLAGEDNEYGRGLIDVVEAFDFLTQSLIADTMEMSVASMQTEVIFSLHGRAANAGREYYLLGSVTGSAPGYLLPGGLTLPIHWDKFTNLTLFMTNSKFFGDFSGHLDGGGNAQALLDIIQPPDPIVVGVVMTFAFCTAFPFDFVSNPWSLEFIP